MSEIQWEESSDRERLHRKRERNMERDMQQCLIIEQEEVLWIYSTFNTKSFSSCNRKDGRQGVNR